MNITDNIIQAALLGTANRDIDFDGLPEALDGVMHAIQRAAHDREEAFYQAAAVAFAYRRAGWEPQPSAVVATAGEAPGEDLPYLGDGQNAMLSRLLQMRFLLPYAYRKAAAMHRIISPSIAAIVAARLRPQQFHRQ